MITDLRRSKRIADYLPVQVFACTELAGRRVAGPFSGRIIDISRHGACLLMTQVLRGTYHVFYSIQQEKDHFLEVDIALDECEDTFVVLARPIWMNLFEQSEIKAYRLGIEFLVQPDSGEMRALRKAMQEHQQERAAWWRAYAP